MTDSWNKIKKTVKRLQGLGLIGSANLIGLITSAFFWLYLAPILGTENYGQVGYFISLASIIGVFCLFGAQKTLMVYRAKEIPIQATIFFIAIILSLASAIILFVFLGNIGTSAFIIGYVIFGIAVAELLGTKLYKKYFNYFITQKIALLPLAIGLYYVIGIEGVILGYALSYMHLIIIVTQGFMKSSIKLSLVREKIGFISHNYLADIAVSLSSNIDRVILAPLYGFALLGNYQLSIQILAVLSMLPSVVFQYLLPREASGTPSRRLRHLTIITAVGLAIVTSALGPFILPIFFAEFNETVLLIQVVSFVLIPRTITLMYISKFLSKENSKVVLISAGLFLAALVSLIYLLEENLGIFGAAIALLVASCIQAGYLFAVNQKNPNN